jgi:DNA-binding NarL/FixJ family response regulator
MEENPMISIVIVEDDMETRNLVANYLESVPHFKVIETFGSAEATALKFNELEIDVCLVDIGLPGMNGIECINKLKAIKPKVNFIVFSTANNNEQLFNALAAGATSYILKHQISKLQQAIEDAVEGTGTFSPGVINRLRDYFLGLKSENQLVKKLTEREMEVLVIASKGKRNKEIAADLNIDETTVKKHMSNIISKLHVGNRVEAINMLLGH